MGIEKHENAGLPGDPAADLATAPTLAHDLATLTRLLLDLPLGADGRPEPVDASSQARRSTALLAELAFLDE